VTHTDSLIVHFSEQLELPTDAIVWLLDLWHMAQVFDDVADGDEIKRADLDKAVWKGLVAMPSNPFYTAHITALQPALATAVLKWKASDDAERAKRADERSFMWRAAYYDIVLLVVLLVHGYDKAMEKASVVMALYGEDFAKYREEFPHA
jgi:hypothetical protein